MKKALLLTFLSLMTSPCTLAMEKETPEFYTSLPTELRSELVAAVFKTNSSTYASMKTVKKLMLTSKQTQMQLKQFFTSDDKITDYCFALKSNTENIFRSLYLFNVYKFIPKQKYNQLDAQFFIQYRDEYDAHRQDEKTFKDECIRLIQEVHEKDRITYITIPLDLNKLQQWINKGINVNIKDSSDDTALTKAVRRGRIEAVKLLLAAPGINLNIEGYNDQSALNYAAEKSLDDIEELLIKSPGINVNSRGLKYETALMWAADNGDTKMVKLLLAAPGIDVNLKEFQGITALMWASRGGAC